MELIPTLLSHSDDLLPGYPERYPPVSAWEPLGEDHVRREWRRVAAEARPVSLYVHLPFCRRICNFCGIIYRRRLAAEAELGGYLEAVAGEAALWAPVLKGARVKSVFLGGGTPTLLAPMEMESTVMALRRAFPSSTDAWFGLEANPDSLDGPRLDALARLGADYISVGVQSFEDAVLAAAGRSHTSSQAWATLERVRTSGSAFLNVDLMAGLQGQTREGFLRDVRALGLWRPDSAHLSYFKPTRFTLWARRGGVERPGDLEVWRSWIEEGFRCLEEYGFRRESEFRAVRAGGRARGRRSRPAGAGGPELGLGAGTFSQAEGALMTQNIGTPDAYKASVARGILPVARGWVSTPRQQAIAFLLSRWRTIGAVNIREFQRALGVPLGDIFSAEMNSLEALGVLERRGHTYVLLPRPSADMDISRAFYEPEIVKRMAAAFQKP